MSDTAAFGLHPAFDEASVSRLVRTFYERARADEMIGPIFVREVQDWDAHVGQITDFWSSMLLRTGRYNGRPLRPHLVLRLEERHFDRWLMLFEQTAAELFPADAAAFLSDRTRRIADSFEMAIGAQDGELRAPRHSVGKS